MPATEPRPGLAVITVTRTSEDNSVRMTTPQSDFPTVSERKKSLLCHSSPTKKKESNPLLNNFSIKPIIQFFNKKLKKDPKLKGSFKIEKNMSGASPFCILVLYGSFKFEKNMSGGSYF